MPYVTGLRRGHLDASITGNAALGVRDMRNAGELTYVLTCIIERYREHHEDRYQIFAEIAGALDGAGKEFYRRVVAPYEDEKQRVNGDVYAPPS